MIRSDIAWTKQNHDLFSCVYIDRLVVIVVPPKVTDTPSSVEGVLNRTTVVTCRASGLPPPKFEFYKVDFTAFTCV